MMKSFVPLSILCSPTSFWPQPNSILRDGEFYRQMTGQILDLCHILIIPFASKVTKLRKCWWKNELSSQVCYSVRTHFQAQNTALAMYLYVFIFFVGWDSVSSIRLCVRLHVSECFQVVAHPTTAFSPRNSICLVDLLGNFNRSNSPMALSDNYCHLQLYAGLPAFRQTVMSSVREGGFKSSVYCCGISSSTAPISCNC